MLMFPYTLDHLILILIFLKFVNVLRCPIKNNQSREIIFPIELEFLKRIQYKADIKKGSTQRIADFMVMVSKVVNIRKNMKLNIIPMVYIKYIK